MSIPIASFSARAQSSVTELEDGRLLVLGGNPSVGAAEAVYYLPVDRRFDDLPTESPPPRSGHAAVRLDDGTVLIVGGVDQAGEPLAEAWVHRPDLTGPFTGNLDITFEGVLAESMVPRDPLLATREPPQGDVPAHYVIESSSSGDGVPSEWAVAAGPLLSEPKIAANVGTISGGVAILLGFTGAADYLFVVLHPDQLAELLSVRNGQPQITGCSGAVIQRQQIETNPDTHRIAVEVTDAQLIASIEEDEVLRCSGIELPRGRVGIGVFGSPSSQVVVNRFAVSR
jgi:hypothetical protein